MSLLRERLFDKEGQIFEYWICEGTMEGPTHTIVNLVKRGSKEDDNKLDESRRCSFRRGIVEGFTVVVFTWQNEGLPRATRRS